MVDDDITDVLELITHTSAKSKWRQWFCHAAREMRAEASNIDGPVNLRTLTEGLQISVKFNRGVQLGHLVFGNSSCTILCSEDLCDVKRRFVIAHELGHYVVQRAARNLSLDAAGLLRAGASADEEALCDAFATELLLPRVVVQRNARRFQEAPLDTIHEVSTRYRMGQFRAAQSFIRGSQDMLLLLFRMAERPGSTRKLRLHSAARPRGWDGPYLPIHLPPDEHSAIMLALNEKCEIQQSESLRKFNLGRDPLHVFAQPIGSEAVLAIVRLNVTPVAALQQERSARVASRGGIETAGSRNMDAFSEIKPVNSVARRVNN